MAEAKRILHGEIVETTVWDFPEGSEPRVVATVAGGTWEIPTDWFTRAGHTVLEAGIGFQAATRADVGMPVRSLEYILPFVDTETNQLGDNNG